MRSTAVRRTALAASAACLALLATACGGSESGGKGGDGDRAGKPAAAEPAAEAKTAAELERLVLAQGDVEGHKVEKPGPGDTTSADEVSVDKAECEPLVHAQFGLGIADPAALVNRMVAQEPTKPQETAEQNDGEVTEEDLENFEKTIKGSFNLTTTMLALSSYDAGGAEKAVADLRAAAGACAGGFTGGIKGDEQKVTGVKEEKVTGGEEALAWTVTTEMAGESVPLKLAVVRQGGTLAVFSSFNFASTESGKDFGLPTAVIDAQAKKLA